MKKEDTSNVDPQDPQIKLIRTENPIDPDDEDPLVDHERRPYPPTDEAADWLA